MVDHLNRAKSNCGHVEKIWEAGGRWYVKFSQFKQDWHIEHVEPREYSKNMFPDGFSEDRGKGQQLPNDWRCRLIQ
ncbi:MAG: hypothetical protein WC516_08550 [Patescibacteria group bacterium]